MQNRGAIKFFAILFALVCLFQLSFTFLHPGLKRRPEPMRITKLRIHLPLKWPMEMLLWKGTTLILYQGQERLLLDSMANQQITTS